MDSNKPFDILDGQFVHGEAVEVSGVPSKTLNNWIQRGLIDIGEMHRTGRRLFSAMDLIELKVLGQLTMITGMTPANAVPLAQYARKRALEISERDDGGELKYKGLKNENRKYLVAWYDKEQYKAKIETLEHFFGEHSIPHAVVVVPLDDIVMRVLNLCADVLERE